MKELKQVIGTPVTLEMMYALYCVGLEFVIEDGKITQVIEGGAKNE